MTKRPDDRWPAAARGLVVELMPGVHGPVEFSGAADMLIQGCEGAVIEGSLAADGPGNPECSIRANDGCHRLAILGPLEIRGSDGRGLRITMADDIQIADLTIKHCSIEGIITGGCPRGTYTNLTVEDSDGYCPGYPPDKCHGLYISGNADGSVVSKLTVRRVTGSGLQVNGAGMNAVASGVRASELVFEHVGSGGTAPISLMAVQDSTFEKFHIDWSAPDDRWGVCFDDGKGPAYACHRVTFQEYTAPRGKECAVEAGSTNIRQEPGAGWSPEEPVPPEPQPEPPDNEALALALADATAAVAAIGRQQAAAQQAVAEIGQQAIVAQEALARATAAAGTQT